MRAFAPQGQPMATNVQLRGRRYQLRVVHKLLPKPFFFTFDDEPQARHYGDQLLALLDQGVVPAELVATPPRGANDPLLIEVIRGYGKAAPITDSDEKLLTMMLTELATLRISNMTYQWADAYVRKLKLVHNLAPGTIRKRVGALGRVIDWHLRSSTVHGTAIPANALRLLPRGYSTYSRADAEALAPGKSARRDVARDLRLNGDDVIRVLTALAGEKRPDRERALDVDPAFQMLFHMIVDTGLRLREAYRLRVDQVDLVKGVIRVEGSKGVRGTLKPRVVPIKPSLAPLLKRWCTGRVGLLFPFWTGDPSAQELQRATQRLSARFKVLFNYAAVPALTEHDLRHEATCRWVEMRNARGWVFSDTEVCKIMGWTSTAMMLRYASLRGEDLVARMA